MTSNDDTRRVNIVLDPDLHRQAKVYCAQRDLSLSALIRDLLEKALADGEGK